MSNIYKESRITIETPSAIYLETPSRIVKSSLKKKAARPKNNPQDILDAAKKQAEEILQAARGEASAILDHAEEGAEQVKRRAYAAGLQQGTEEGMRRAAKQESAKVSDLQTVIDRLDQTRDTMRQAAYEEAEDFAFRLAEKIIGMEIDRNDEAFYQICRNAAGHMAEATRVVLKVGPRGYAVASRYYEQIKKCFHGLGELVLEPDDGREDGDCLLEAPAGSVDASVRTQLQKAQELIHPGR